MHIDLHDIVTEEFQEQMQNSFARLSGFGVVFTDSEGVHIGKGGNFTRFCQAINCREDGASCCALTNRQAIRMALDSPHPDRPAIFVCHAGLVNIELPILHEGKCLGAFTAGQVLCEEDCYPRDNSQLDVNWQEDPQLAEYYKEIPVLSRRHIENTADLMCDLAQYILKTHTYSLMQKKLARQMEELLLYEKRQVELEHLLMQTKFDALQKQVMPHFIFNVLNSVSRLISMRDYDRAQEMLNAFTHMMRYSLSNTQQTILLCQELDYVRNYLAIQQLRFGDRIQYEICCDPEMESLQLPFFTLQPLVENSIEHGILHMSEGGRLFCIADACRRNTVLNLRITVPALMKQPLRIFESACCPLPLPATRSMWVYTIVITGSRYFTGMRCVSILTVSTARVPASAFPSTRIGLYAAASGRAILN